MPTGDTSRTYRSLDVAALFLAVVASAATSKSPPEPVERELESSALGYTLTLDAANPRATFLITVEAIRPEHDHNTVPPADLLSVLVQEYQQASAAEGVTITLQLQKDADTVVSETLQREDAPALSTTLSIPWYAGECSEHCQETATLTLELAGGASTSSYVAEITPTARINYLAPSVYADPPWLDVSMTRVD